jgi:hypothetical protein
VRAAIVSLALAIACSHPEAPQPPALAAAAMSVTMDVGVFRMAADGTVTVNDKPVMKWNGAAFLDLDGRILLATDGTGHLTGLWTNNHPHFESNGRLVEGDGTMMIDDSGAVRLYTNAKQVGDPIQVTGMTPQAKQTAGMFVMVAMVYSMIERAKKPAAGSAVAP